MSKVPELDALIDSGEILTYSIDTIENRIWPSYQILSIVFPSGKAITVKSECGSGSDSNSWLEIDG